MRLLIAAGADVNYVGDDGETPLILAANQGNAPDKIALLIHCGADPDWVTACPHGLAATSLIGAVASGSRQNVVTLLRLGASVDLPDHDGNTPLLIAARSGRLSLVLRLLEAGANPRHRNHAR